MLEDSHKGISHAILKTVAYSDIFDHPLSAREIHRYLVAFRLSFEELESALNDERSIIRIGEFFILPGREEILPIRMERENRSKKLMPQALQIGRILGALPFIRMVALTGSLAVMNVSKTDDFDFMLVTVPGRVWTARAFALLFNRITKLFGHTICPNLIVSENSLAWPLQDLYSARELCQMIPITGMDEYRKLIRLNSWAADFLPNAFLDSNRVAFEDLHGNSPSSRWAIGFQKLFEFLLRGKVGDRFENWEMDRKIRRFSKQEGFGEETIFNAEVCQGNFHHHRKWTHDAFQKRLNTTRKVSSLPKQEGLDVRAA